ncbi:MAG: glycosyltransferase family 2 protein [Bacteroidales bacterium]|nr:glycosyltransferase family 2 protein [Bacteroidales bacterium]
MSDLVSIIMPVYNGEKYIKDAVNSVLGQSYTNWELLIINDGSVDKTENIIEKYTDSRIKYFCTQNNGVSQARNFGLDRMNGSYFCFLDADDMLSLNSIEDRIKLFIENPDLDFVDGMVGGYSNDFSQQFYTKTPNFRGHPYPLLIQLSDQVFSGITWLIKRDLSYKYHFKTGMTHAEDLLFYIDISKNKKYNYIPNEIYKIRNNTLSAMSNLDGLSNGYKILFNELKNKHKLNHKELWFFKKRVIRIMVYTYLKKLRLCKAINEFFKFILL